jgi:putative two-component system response regulator
MIETNGRKATVLIVDDSPDSATLLSSMLKDTYRVKVAITGEKSLAIAASEDPPDLILLDVVMPGIDGYEACRRLKQNPLTADIPVIFLTAKSEKLDEEKGLELGAEDYIAKPPSAPIVMARIRTHLRLKNVRDFLKAVEIINKGRGIHFDPDIAEAFARLAGQFRETASSFGDNGGGER